MWSEGLEVFLSMGYPELGTARQANVRQAAPDIGYLYWAEYTDLTGTGLERA